jgi:hypothetical protein
MEREEAVRPSPHRIGTFNFPVGAALIIDQLILRQVAKGNFLTSANRYPLSLLDIVARPICQDGACDKVKEMIGPRRE